VIGLDLPLRRDVPAEHDAVRRLVDEHARPLAFAPVDAAVVDPPADARLEDRFRYLDVEHVVLARLDAVEVLGEDREGPFERHVHDYLRPHGRVLGLCVHETSSVRCSATAL
jgi:hypothetical protein